MTGASGVSIGACPDEAVIAEFAQGGLPRSEADALEAHLDGCDSCAKVVADLARIFHESKAGRSGEDAALQSEELATTLGTAGEEPMPQPIGQMLAAGAQVGRYRVLECVGVGGMGVVYSAYDPELDRRIALKLLRGSKNDPAKQARNGKLLREAQALAKLTHPNVITVHDVGTWEEQVFVAMEFVDGLTLGEWLAQERRTWPEIREVFVAAGRGVVAAHAEGMVHRDFKPDNVLIGKEGRVRVTDFGLARWGQVTLTAEALATDELRAVDLRRPSADSISQLCSPAVALTETGTLVGTPAYMAPEQYEQRSADPSTDQFAFCVALFEAIYGERPFAGRTVAELASNVLDGRLSELPSAMTVPRVARQAIRRGLSRKRADRFGSMNELLAVLDRRPARRGRVAVVIAAPLFALGAGIWAYQPDEVPRSAFCRGEHGLAEVWPASRREVVRGAFEATELPYAAETSERVLAAVDAYADRWEALRSRSCEPEVDDEGPGVVALRERCLLRRRVALSTVLEVFEQVDARMVGRAVGAVAGLPELDRCADAEALMADLPPPVPLAQREQVEAIRDEIARGDGLIAGGRYDDGLAFARELDARAITLGHEPLVVETRYLLAQMLDRTGDPEAAYEAFEESILLAAASRHRRYIARAMAHQVYVLGVSMPRMEEAERVARRAEAEMEGSGLEEEVWSGLLLNRGSVAYRLGHYEAAAEFCRRALALRDRDREPLRWADAAFNLATIDMSIGNEARANAGLQDYIEVFEAELGAMHPEVAAGYQNLGVSYYHQGRYDEAKAALENAESIRRQSLGVDHPAYADTINMLGSVAVGEGRLDEGLEYIRRSIAILEVGNFDEVEIATNRGDLASVLVELGELDEAEREAEKALETMRGVLGDEHPSLGPTLLVLAEVAAARGDAEGVRRHLDRLASVRAGALGEDHKEIDRMQVDRARLLDQCGEREEALALLRGLLVEGEGGAHIEAKPLLRLQLADILWAEPERRVDARTEGERALAEFEVQELVGGAAVAREWLDAHPR